MYIITGGAGFIGSAMIWKLNNMGIDDILVVDNLGVSEKWKNLVNRRYASYIHRDAFLEMIHEDALDADVEAIIHMGACSSTTERDADFLMQNNLEYTKALCLYAASKKARFINASSASTYGDGSLGFEDEVEDLYSLRPLNMYGYSKHLFDIWAQKFGYLDNIVSLKFFNVYGPNEQHKGDMRSVVNKAFYQIQSSGKMQLFKSSDPLYADGGQMRDFVYIKDCVEIMWWLLKHPKTNGIFNVGTGKARTWVDLVTAVFSAMNKPVNIEFIPLPEHLHGKYQNFTEANMHKLRTAGCNLTTHSLEQDVADYVQSYLQAPDGYL